MNEKLDSLISVLGKIHEKMNKKYKNIEKIDGQYNFKIETIARVLALQTQNKMNVYNSMLMDASKMETEITQEGHRIVIELLNKCEKVTSKSTTVTNENLLKAALDFSNAKIQLFSGVMEVLDRFEQEKGIKHMVLKDKVETILELENKDILTIKSFL